MKNANGLAREPPLLHAIHRHVKRCRHSRAIQNWHRYLEIIHVSVVERDHHRAFRQLFLTAYKSPHLIQAHWVKLPREQFHLPFKDRARMNHSAQRIGNARGNLEHRVIHQDGRGFPLQTCCQAKHSTAQQRLFQLLFDHSQPVIDPIPSSLNERYPDNGSNQENHRNLSHRMGSSQDQYVTVEY